ncbi:MAG TPA: feruloyl-CoA synthase [Terriglobia bacterium]|jgi:feruloyl-CoA synthase
METAADRVPLKFLARRVDVERRTDGTLVLCSPEPLRPYERCLGEYLERWAREKPDAVFLAERAGEGWRTITWRETRQTVYGIATALLSQGVSVERPVAVLSDNSIDHALMALAAMHIGVPVAPISPAYSLMSRDFAKLRTIIDLIEPGLIFVDHPEQFERALTSIRHHRFELVTSANIARLTQVTDEALVQRIFSSIGPETIAKFLFTSGSTGQPKAVINTQRMLCSNIQSRAQAWPFLDDEPPVLVDWLPWNHTFGGNNDFGMVLAHAGTMYIDAGKPAPGLIETTVRNLREVSATISLNAPRGYDALLPFFEKDAQLRRTFFARLRVILYAAAALPVHVWDRLEQLSIQETGRRMHMVSGWGSTETAPQVTIVHYESRRTSVIGLPSPGYELKMVPVDNTGKYELRVRGSNVTPGYWKRPDLTAAAFDEENFYKMGDAGRFADPEDPAQGIEFAGRLAEDFKLTSATWVHVGALRMRAIAAMAPVAQDIVIAGHDCDDVGFLIFPAPGCCATDQTVRNQVREGMIRLRAEGGGSSTYAARAVLLDEPPSIDAGEITDKGYINQRAVLESRAEIVKRLYAQSPDDLVIVL